MKDWLKLLKSKTVWAGILLGGQQIIDAVVPALANGALGEKVALIVQGLAIILGAVGIKSAILKGKDV